MHEHKTFEFYFITEISQLPHLFIGTPRICNFILLLIVLVRFLEKCYLP